MKKINVLSLFDGISCGQVALERVGIEAENYYASEIDKYAIQITQNNYPNTIQLGDINNWQEWGIDFSKIDLIIGGSPCQGFSIAGKKLNFEDKRSKLFFKYLEILNFAKSKNPKVKFLLENVKMKFEIAEIIDKELGINHIYINSRYFTGMIRKRFYWFNWEMQDYKKQDIKIKDFIEDLPYTKNLNELFTKTVYNPSTSTDGIMTLNPRKTNGEQTWQRGRVYDINGYCPTIQASMFEITISKDHKMARSLTINELEKLQGLPKNYTEGIPKAKRGQVLGNGWTTDVITHILKGLKYN